MYLFKLNNNSKSSLTFTDVNWNKSVAVSPLVQGTVADNNRMSSTPFLVIYHRFHIIDHPIKLTNFFVRRTMRLDIVFKARDGEIREESGNIKKREKGCERHFQGKD